MKRQDLRNLAIIAHIDHGKTTLVDGLLRQSGLFRANQVVAERVLDCNELERERGITILAKVTSVDYRGITLNIVDTPGHVDFSGEVERVLGMVDGALLVVDAAEGPGAQTRFVLKKALEAGLVPILVVNKVDRPDARPAQVVDEVLELFMDLAAQDHQLDFPIVYASARQQKASLEPGGGTDLAPLFETIVETIPCPQGEADLPLQMLVSMLDYDDYLGRLAIGRILQGTLRSGSQVAFGAPGAPVKVGKVSGLFRFHGLERRPVQQASVGDIAVVAGLGEVSLGHTLTDPDWPVLLPGLKVDEPTLAMDFLVSDGPLAGREGRYVTSRHLADRLRREVERNVGLRVLPGPTPDVFCVHGRGELHLSILLETMRREGYELCVGCPRVLTRTVEGALHEPLEMLYLDLPEESLGPVMELLGSRRAEVRHLAEAGAGRVRLEAVIPARGLVGLRSEILTLTRGYGAMSHLFWDYGPWRGEIARRTRGSLVASEGGVATSYALASLQDRGVFFISPGDPVYPGMVVGEHCRPGDLEINVCRARHVTNIRRSTAEETVKLEPPRRLTLEQALEFLADDELLELTPRSLRLRKAILDSHQRARARRDRARLTTARP